MTSIETIARIVLIGAGATAVMDAWLVFLRRMGVQTLNFGFIGRWVGHLFRGRFSHEAIGRSAPIPGELALGWFTHYLTGIAFAALLFVVQGAAWIGQPSILPALATGVCTVAAPLLVMQPAMGLGIAATKTPTPLRNCFRSLGNHLVFGLGLYLSATALAWILQ